MTLALKNLDDLVLNFETVFDFNSMIDNYKITWMLENDLLYMVTYLLAYS